MEADAWPLTRNPRCAGGWVGGLTAWTRVATRALDAVARGAFTATPRVAVTEESWEAIIVFRRCLECDTDPARLGATTFRGSRAGGA